MSVFLKVVIISDAFFSKKKKKKFNLLYTRIVTTGHTTACVNSEQNQNRFMLQNFNRFAWTFL